MWDTVAGLVSLVSGLIKFSAATDVLVVCELIDISLPKWAKNTYDKGIESAKMFVSLQWIPALGQKVMDSVEEDGVFYANGEIGEKMLKSELIEVLEKEKINLVSLQIVIGRKTNVPFSLGCCEEEGIWKIYEIGERQSFDVILTGSEEEVFEEMYSLIKGKFKIMQRLEKMD